MDITILINILISGSAIFLSYASNRNFWLLSFSQFFVLLYFFFLIIGCYYLVYLNPHVYRNTLYLVNSGFLFFCLGSFISSNLNKLSKHDFLNFRNASIQDSYLNMPTAIALTIIAAVSVVLSAFYFKEGIPFYSHDVDEARLEASSGGGYFYVGFAIFLPIVVLILKCKAYYMRSNKYTVAFYATLIICISLQMLSGYRAPLLNLLAMLLILHNYLKGRFTFIWQFFSELHSGSGDTRLLFGTFSKRIL